MTNILKATALIASATTVALFTACSSEEGEGGSTSSSYDPNAAYSVTIKTNKGDIEADLYNDIASVYVENFVNLAESGFFTNSPWHRVIQGFVIQGGTSAEGKTVDQFEDVFHPDMKHDSARHPVDGQLRLQHQHLPVLRHPRSDSSSRPVRRRCNESLRSQRHLVPRRIRKSHERYGRGPLDRAGRLHGGCRDTQEVGPNAPRSTQLVRSNRKLGGT